MKRFKKRLAVIKALHRNASKMELGEPGPSAMMVEIGVCDVWDLIISLAQNLISSIHAQLTAEGCTPQSTSATCQELYQLLGEAEAELDTALQDAADDGCTITV